MSYQGQAWVDEVALPQLQNTGELVVMLRVANHAGNGPTKMSGCHAAAGTIARECLMGRSTALKHLRELTRRGLLVPGDPALVEHLPADKRPPVYDLGGAHKAGCVGGHTYLEECQTAGVQIEHPQKKPRSAGAHFEHPHPDDTGSTGVAGVQIEHGRVFKSSTNSSKELKESSLSAGGPPFAPDPDPSAEAEREREEASPTDAEQVLAAYEEALGGPALNGTRAKILADAAELLAARPLWWVIARARELPKYGTDLGKHAAMSTVPFAKKPPARPAGLPQEDPDYKPVQRDMSELRSILDAMRQPSI